MSSPEAQETVINLDDAKAPAATPADNTVPESERLYGGQFKTVEELEAAYSALNAPAADAPKPPALIDEGASDADVADALTKAGLNLDDFSEEFNTNGRLSEDSYAKLEQAGYPKELVDVYVDGLRARVQSFEQAVYAPVGGKDEYTALLTWAASNVSAEHKRVFNDAIASGDAGRASMAVQGLIALRGGNGRLLTGKTATTDPGIQPYASQAQAIEAVRDPRYARDPAYRKAHEARLALSPFFT